jgi:hypothetical protein
VIMEAQNEEEIRLEENPEQGPTREPGQNSEGSSATQVLETMRKPHCGTASFQGRQ